MHEYFNIDKYDFILLGAAIVALFAAIVPVAMQRRNLSAPIIYLLTGFLSYFLILHYFFKPMDYLQVIKRITEFVAIVALTNAGLKIKEPFKWHTWKYSFRLLLIGMPLTIAAAAFLGWWILSLAPATAMLFGALISPTDPVLAGEMQTSQPSKKDTSKIKLGLTSEAGLNDGLAFPFTYFAILAASKGTKYKEWIWQWLLHDVLIKTIIAIAVGLFVGWALYKMIFSITSKDMLSKISRGILSLSLTLLPYTITEIVGGYGFIAVFVAACMFSRYEKFEKHMDRLHDFNEELESVVVAIIFIATGIFIASHYQIILNPMIIVTALLMILVVRPAAGYLSLWGTDLNRFQRFVLSFYGIRGIGSVYYLAFALTATQFYDEELLFEITMATIFFSVMIHGLTARMVQVRIKKYDYTE